MPHGQPDFGTYTQKITTYGLADMGELAVRLGSPDTFDRRGDIVFLDDFEHGIEKCDFILRGAGAAAAWVSTQTRTKGFSVELIAGSTLQRQATLRFRTPYPAISNFGVEASFSIGLVPESVFLAFSLYTGTQRVQGSIRIDTQNDRLQYADAAGVQQIFAPVVPFFKAVGLFNFSKMVMDLTNRTYRRCIFNNVEYDLSAFALEVTPDLVTAPHISWNITVFSVALTNAVIYVDDMILTQNEP